MQNIVPCAKSKYLLHSGSWMVNDDNLFRQCFKEIYPAELQWNLEGSGDTLSYLDLALEKNKQHIDVKLFDKRDAFPFSIVRLPFASSNIPTSMFYSSISAEVLRIGRICFSQRNFLTSAKPVIGPTNKGQTLSNY